MDTFVLITIFKFELLLLLLLLLNIILFKLLPISMIYIV
jgi:hypothetical protein